MKKVLTVVMVFALVGVVYGANPKEPKNLSPDEQQKQAEAEHMKVWSAYGKITGGQVITLSKSCTVPVTPYTIVPKSPQEGEALVKSIVNSSAETNLKENASVIADFKKLTDKKVFYTKGGVTFLYKEGNFVYAEVVVGFSVLPRKINIGGRKCLALPVANMGSQLGAVNVEFYITGVRQVSSNEEAYFMCDIEVLRLQPTADDLTSKQSPARHYFAIQSDQVVPVPTWDETKAIALTSDTVLSRTDVKAMKSNKENFDIYRRDDTKPENGVRVIKVWDQNDLVRPKHPNYITDNVLKDVAKQSVYWLVECIVVDGKLEPLRGCPLKDWPTPKDWKPYTPYVPKAASQPASQPSGSK